MTIELQTFSLEYNKPVDGGKFLAGLEDLFNQACKDAREVFRIYEGVGSRIITHRNRQLLEWKAQEKEKELSEQEYWGADPAAWSCHTSNWGLLLRIHLGKKEGFDVLGEYYEWLSHQTKHVRANVRPEHRICEPDPEDWADIRRRSWQFRVGEARCTLAGFAHYDSEVCKLIPDKQVTTYRLECEGSKIGE